MGNFGKSHSDGLVCVEQKSGIFNCSVVEPEPEPEPSEP